MPRPKTIEAPVVSSDFIETFIERYDDRKRVVDEQKEVYDARKRELNDFRNVFATETSLYIPPVEFAVKKARENSPTVCVNWLRAMVLTFKHMGVFDQADMFLVNELVEEIGTSQTEAAA